MGLGVFVKVYGLILIPWLFLAGGLPAVSSAAAFVIAVGLLAPALIYGWQGNLEQIAGLVAHRHGHDNGAESPECRERFGNVRVDQMDRRRPARHMAGAGHCARCRSPGCVRREPPQGRDRAALSRVWPADAARSPHLAAGLGLLAADCDAGNGVHDRIDGRSSHDPGGSRPPPGSYW